MTAYVENPEAVGDPNQTPRVRLFPLVASEPIEQRDALKIIEEHLAKVGFWEFGGTRHVRDALDLARAGTHPDVPAPGRAGRFETLLGAEHEQFDQRGELLRSVVEYMDAPSGTVSVPAPGRSGEEQTDD